MSVPTNKKISISLDLVTSRIKSIEQAIEFSQNERKGQAKS